MSLSRKPTAFERHAAITFSVLFTYPIPHMVTTPLIRWQAWPGNVWSMPYNQWGSSIYKIMLKNEYKGLSNLPRDFTTLFQGYWAGFLYKELQSNIRYPFKGLYYSWIQKNQQIFGKFSEELKHAIAGSGAAITEAVLHPLDTVRNILMNAEKKMSLEEIWKVVKVRNVKLLNGIEFTVFRNSIGGFTQFGVNELMIRKFYKVEDKQQLTKTQISISSWVAAMAMIFATQPFANKKVKKQLGLESRGFFSWKGGIYTACTKSIGPALTLAAYELIVGRLTEHRIERENSTRYKS